MSFSLPKTPAAQTIYGGLMILGSSAFSLASIILIVALGIISFRLLENRKRNPMINSTGFLILLVFLTTTILLMLPSHPRALVDIHSLVSLSLIGLAVITVQLSISNSALKAASLFMGVSYGTLYFYKSGTLLTPMLPPSILVEVFNIGEITVLASVPFIFRVYNDGDWSLRHIKRFMVIPTSVVGFFTLGYLINPWLTGVFATWSLNFQFFLPFPVYAAALWLYFFTVQNAWTYDRNSAYGLIFIFLAGRMIQLSYFNLLAVLGILLFTGFTSNYAGLKHPSGANSLFKGSSANVSIESS